MSLSKKQMELKGSVSKNMQEQKYVLVLGAGLMQRPSIEAVKNLGYKAFVVDGNPNALCVPFADRFEPIDLKDKERLAKLAQSLGTELAAVFTAGTDFSTTVSYIAERCSLPAHTYEAAQNASNKVRMRECFKRADVSSPSFQEIERAKITAFLAPDVFDAMQFPKVVKPVDNMGARGCRMIRSKQEFLPAVEDAVRASRTGRAILEDYMDGPEFSIDAIVYKNELTITGFADRHIFYPPYFIETGHTMPTNIAEEKRLELIGCFAKAVHALGLTCGAAKADIKYTDKGPMVGEIAARLSGGYMSGWTYPYAADFDLTEQALLVALDKEPQQLLLRRKPLPVSDAPFGIYEVDCSRTSAERAWISIPGKVACIYGTDYASAIPYTRNMLIRSTAGSSVVFPRNNVEKCGNSIAVSAQRALAVKAAEDSVASIVLRLEKNNSATDTFLSGESQKSERNFPPDAYQLTPEQRKLFKEFVSTAENIPQNMPVSKLIPPCLKECASTLKDYNHRTMSDSLALYDKICSAHPMLDGKKFWQAFMRGGLQALLYVTDCTVTYTRETKKR